MDGFSLYSWNLDLITMIKDIHEFHDSDHVVVPTSLTIDLASRCDDVTYENIALRPAGPAIPQRAGSVYRFNRWVERRKRGTHGKREIIDLTLVGGVPGTWLDYFSIYWEIHHPNWRTHIFQRGWNHQPVTSGCWSWVWYAARWCLMYRCTMM